MFVYMSGLFPASKLQITTVTCVSLMIEWLTGIACWLCRTNINVQNNWCVNNELEVFEAL